MKTWEKNWKNISLTTWTCPFPKVNLTLMDWNAMVAVYQDQGEIICIKNKQK